MKFTKRSLWGANSLWAKICKLIGKYPEWVYQRIVSVVVCTESGLLSTIHCRDRGTIALRAFKELEAPTEFCPLDHIIAIPPTKPYVGTSFYQILTASAEEIIWWVRKLYEHKANATEMFLYFDWPLAKNPPWQSYPTSGWKFSPHVIVDWWSEPKFGNYKFPKFDLEKYNPDIWNRVRLFFSECQKYEIAVFIRIQDYCSIKRPFYKRHYPYNNGSNVQHYTGGTCGEPIRKWYRADNEKLMQTINEAKLKHYYIISQNEADAIGEDSDEWKDNAVKELHEFYIDDFMARGVSKEQFIINIDRPNVRKHFKDKGIRVEIHGINSPKRMRECFASHGNEVFPNGDGPDPYAKGQKSAGGNTEASKEQAVEMAEIVKAADAPGFMYFNRRTESLPHSGDVRLANFDALDGLVKGFS